MQEAVIHLLEEAGESMDGGQRVRLRSGEVLIEEGAAADTVYVLLEGRLSVS